MLQFKADSTLLLYELNFPDGPAAARWRVLFDTDHNGVVSPAEYARLARGLAVQIARDFSVSLEGGRIAWEVVDAKVTPSAGREAMTGKLAALVLLKTRALPGGLRRVTISAVPQVDTKKPVLVRLEAETGEVKDIVGCARGAQDGENPSVAISAGDACVLHVEVPVAKAK